MLIEAQRYLEIHDRRVSSGGGFVISTQLERQSHEVKRWPVWLDHDRIPGGSFLRPSCCCCLTPFAVQV